MPKAAKWIVRASVVVFLVACLFSIVMWVQLQNEKKLEVSKAKSIPTPVTSNENSSLTADSDLVVAGDLIVEGATQLKGGIKLPIGQTLITGLTGGDGKVLTVDETGKLLLVTDNVGSNLSTTITQVTSEKELPSASKGGTIYYDGTGWKSGTNLYNIGGNIGIHSTSPAAALHIDNNNASQIGFIVEAYDGQTASLTEWRDKNGVNIASIGAQGKLTIRSSANDHSIELYPTGDAGYLSSSGGAFFIDNTNNIGTGIGIYSNAGAEALGNMINVKVDNPLYNQAAFYMNYDGLSNAVEIVSNSTDTSSNALSVTGFNPNDSTVGIIGYETGRGTVKITHNGTGNDDNASALSIDLAGTGTDAQGIYVDSTASGGTDGNLLRLRNQTLDRFVVSSLGSVTIGRNGTNTSITKNGNTVGDEFFVGTNGAFRVQRSATDSEAFRTQIVGDTQGRWLGTSDGKLKFGDGSSAQDVIMQRGGVGLMRLDGDFEIFSQATNNDVLRLLAFDDSQLFKVAETSGGDGFMEIDAANGLPVVMLRADGGDSYISSGNFGLGTSLFGTSAANVLALGNGTAPTTSIANGIQLFAEDVSSSSELRVRDEAGNVSTLSPHNFSLIPGGPSEEMAWSFYSEKNDIAINADITKALRILEDLSGEKLVYIKDLATNEYVPKFSDTTNFSALLDAALERRVSVALAQSVSRQEFEQHVSLAGGAWSFVKKIFFKAGAVFGSSVEFLANATFRGTISVSANTAGTILIPPNTSKYKVSFQKPFEQKPLVYVTSANTSVEHKVVEISHDGFSVEIIRPLPESVAFQWLALISEGDMSRLEVVESSQNENIAPTIETGPAIQTPQPTAIPEPTAVPQIDATSSATAE